MSKHPVDSVSNDDGTSTAMLPVQTLSSPSTHYFIRQDTASLGNDITLIAAVGLVKNTVSGIPGADRQSILEPLTETGTLH